MICQILAGDETYSTLGLWGKPVIWYTVQAVLDAHLFDEIFVQTNSDYIKHLVAWFFADERVSIGYCKSPALSIDSRCALVTPNAIQNRLEALDKQEQPEAWMVVDSPMNFELALSLLRQRTKPVWLRKMVLDRINEKKEIFNTLTTGKHALCLVGHSQYDQWEIENISGFQIRNAGVSGITAHEYLNDILRNDLLKLRLDEKVCVLLGVNDIAENRPIDTIAADVVAVCVSTLSGELVMRYTVCRHCW